MAKKSSNSLAVVTTEAHPKTLWPNSRNNLIGSGSCAASFIFQIHFKDIVMNTKTFFIAAAIGAITTLGAGSAFATEVSLELPMVYTSTLSRANVHADAARVKWTSRGERNIVVTDTGPALTRAQVKAELLEAVRIGAIDRHEQSVTPTAAQLESIRQAGLNAVVMTMASR
jgi:hypothetical protein